MVEVRKKGGESTAALIRRFSYRIQKSGILERAKKARFYHKPKTKREKKATALRRLEKKPPIQR